jgi:hypothetical protein
VTLNHRPSVEQIPGGFSIVCLGARVLSMPTSYSLGARGRNMWLWGISEFATELAELKTRVLPDVGRRHTSRDPASPFGVEMRLVVYHDSTCARTVELTQFFSPAHLGRYVASGPPNHWTPCQWMGMVWWSVALIWHIPGA